MFKNLNYGFYGGPLTIESPTAQHLLIVDKLVKICDDKWRIDFVSEDSKRLLKDGVITITNGVQIEKYQYMDLLFYKIPPVLFSNNKYYMTFFRRDALKDADPLVLLLDLAKRYYQKIKKKTLIF